MAGKSFTARYEGKCCNCGTDIVIGTQIVSIRRSTFAHVGCLPSRDSKADAEYMAGRRDAQNYRDNQRMFGSEQAESLQMQAEHDRYWRFGEDY